MVATFKFQTSGKQVMKASDNHHRESHVEIPIRKQTAGHGAIILTRTPALHSKGQEASRQLALDAAPPPATAD